MRPIYYLLSLTFVQSFSAHAQLQRAWNAQGTYYNSSYTNHTLKGSGKAKAIQMMDAVIVRLEIRCQRFQQFRVRRLNCPGFWRRILGVDAL